MEFKVVNKFLQEQNKTFVAIRCQDPYTAYDRILEGNHMGETDETLIQAVKKMVQIENDPSGAMSSMQQLIDLTSQKTNENETIVKRMDKLQAVFIEYTIASGHMPIKTYQAISLSVSRFSGTPSPKISDFTRWITSLSCCSVIPTLTSLSLIAFRKFLMSVPIATTTASSLFSAIFYSFQILAEL